MYNIHVHVGKLKPCQSLLKKSPELWDVHKLLSPNSYKWDDIGRALRVSYSYRREVERERISDVTRLERVLAKWKESKSVPVTWDKLIEGLDEIELRNVISSVKEFLKTDKALATYSSLADWTGKGIQH